VLAHQTCCEGGHEAHLRVMLICFLFATPIGTTSSGKCHSTSHIFDFRIIVVEKCGSKDGSRKHHPENFSTHIFRQTLYWKRQGSESRSEVFCSDVGWSDVRARSDCISIKGRVYATYAAAIGDECLVVELLRRCCCCNPPRRGEYVPTPLALKLEQGFGRP
jgi:hypothetical protein